LLSFLVWCSTNSRVLVIEKTIFATGSCGCYLSPPWETKAAGAHRIVVFICWSTHHHKKNKQLKIHAAYNLLSCSKVPPFTPHFLPFFSWLFKKICEISSYMNISAWHLEKWRLWEFLSAILLKTVINIWWQFYSRHAKRGINLSL
jgi:hypothetical protein